MMNGFLVLKLLLGSLMATAINRSLSPAEVSDWGWRLAFVLGGLFGIIAMYLRVAGCRRRQSLPSCRPVRRWSRDCRSSGCSPSQVRRTALHAADLVLSAAIVVVILMAPTYLQKVHAFTPTVALQANLLAVLSLTIGCMVMGYLADRFGAAWCCLVVVCCWRLLRALLSAVGHRSGLALLALCVAGLFVGIVGVVPYAVNL